MNCDNERNYSKHVDKIYKNKLTSILETLNKKLTRVEVLEIALKQVHIICEPVIIVRIQYIIRL
jgi:hypothetical protein